MNPRQSVSRPPLVNGFIDVPRIVKEGRVGEFFPGLLPNIEDIRKRDFPLFERDRRVYLDSGATSQEPVAVIERMHEHRLSHLRGSNHSRNTTEARRAQEEYDAAKEKISAFFHAHNYHVAFTSGTTGTSNLLATRFAYGRDTLVLATEAEHNSQIVTARNFAGAAGVKFAIIPVTRDGALDLNVLRDVVMRFDGPILLNLVHASNVTGTVNNVQRIRELVGDRVLIYLDMAQSAGHIPIDLDRLDVDFAGVSAHKMYGPTGIGAFFISGSGEEYLTNLVSGGGAVQLVSMHETAYSRSPDRFEPGTQNLEGAVEWGFALDYLSAIGMDRIAAHDEELGKYFGNELEKIPGIVMHSPAGYMGRIPIFVFNSRDLRYDAFARALDQEGISVRDGCFCAHILMSRFLGKPPEFMDMMAMMLGTVGGDQSMLPGAVRASFAFYNNISDAHRAILAINQIAESHW
ncbi:Cysteine desulfurase [Candidatus Bilamarchaeum dharawalense]|uniref:Cysteine desulfurase n=1 Tax=Candidatus Bilamarchaeum dharawalense TaxID=2885759 RepID=A0A5E4LSC1_9ARCH|nr:Cysteine desulfurase [Candidatus Bilamarchaeum dharawalense]